ncbi:MAG: ATP-binding protein [Gemmatimonadales bacterium]|nr:ATP-binding protein [Gemmatimonadales bacterium]
MINRELERARLADLLATGRQQMALLYGRRRVGKTYLLTHLWAPEEVFYFTASDTTGEQNRRALLTEFAAWSGTEVVIDDYPTWRTVFRLLLDHRAPEPLVLVLDEFQYLGETAAALTAVTSELNAVWEARRPSRPLLLVLSGSAVGVMDTLDGAAAPLYGRVAWKHQVEPFDYWDAARMVPCVAARDRALTYGIFGGMPRYLADVDPRRPVADNAAQLALSPGGSVRLLAETAVLQEQGLREISRYTAILRAIGAGSTELNEIGQRAGLGGDTGLRAKIERLVGLGFVQAHRNLGAKRTHAYRYRLADPALMFHYRFVAPNETTLERATPRAAWASLVAPFLDSYMGHLFERIVEQAYHRHHERVGLPLVREWGRWEGRDSRKEPLELDIATRLADARVLTGGIKWNSKPLGARWYAHHEQMLTRLSLSGVEWAHDAVDPESPVLFVAAGGFTAAFEEAARAARSKVILWTLDDLYRSDSIRD